MQIQPVNYVNTKNWQSNQDKTLCYITPAKTDLFFGRNKHTRKVTTSECDLINESNVRNIIVIPPNKLKSLFKKSHKLNINRNRNNILRNITGYDKCNLTASKNTIINNAKLFEQINIIENAKIHTILDTKFVDINNPKKSDSINCIYINTSAPAIINSVITNTGHFTNGTKINEINTNKLIVTKQSDKYPPVTINKAIISNEEIKTTNYLKTHSDDNKFSNMALIAPQLFRHRDESEFIDIDHCKINELHSNKLYAKNSNILTIYPTSNEFILYTDANTKIGNIEFSETNGTVKIKNNGKFIPNPNVINGIKEYELEKIGLENFTAQKNLTVGNCTRIKNLEVEDEDAIITIIGNAKIENINFKKNGKVILKDNVHSVHPNSEHIKITNGELIKAYPPKGLEKVAGMNELKEQLKTDVIEPLLHPELYKSYGLDVLNGFLLYGPPGCGKTYIAKLLAEETGRYFIEITPSNVGSSYQHKTVKNIADSFKKARENAPSIVFIDETEALAPSRDQLTGDLIDTNEQVTELLQQLNNSNTQNILVICASNEPQKIDKAIKRTGRLDKRIFVGPPDIETRKELFKLALNKIQKKETDIDIEKLASYSELYTAQDINMLVRQAAISALKKNILVNENLIIEAFQKVKPSIDSETVEIYKQKGEF